MHCANCTDNTHICEKFHICENYCQICKVDDVKRNINVIAYKFTGIDTILLSTARFYAFRDLIFMMIIILYNDNNNLCWE